MIGQCTEMMRMMGGSMMGGMMGSMFVWMLFGVALLAIGVVLLTRWLGPHSSTPNTALRILQERYARGEIDREEYVERSRLLQT